MKCRLTIETGRRLPGQSRPKHKMFVAWAELNGQPITGQLAAHNNRDMAEVEGVAELARRMRHVLDHAWRAPESKGQASKSSESKAPDSKAPDSKKGS